MAARRRFTFAFPPELASHLEAVIPPRQRNQFVADFGSRGIRSRNCWHRVRSNTRQ